MDKQDCIAELHCLIVEWTSRPHHVNTPHDTLLAARINKLCDYLDQLDLRQKQEPESGPEHDQGQRSP